MSHFHSTRRTFLGGAAAAASLAGTSMPAGATEASAPFKLGIATYSLREFQRGLAIRMVRKLGISYVSVKEFHLPYRSTPAELARGAKEFADAGLTIASGGVITLAKDDDADMRRYFDYARACTMPMMIISPTHEDLPRVETFVKEYNIKAAIHNHGPEDKQFPTPQAVLKAIEGMDPRLGLCIDLGHTARAGADPVESIREAGTRLLDLHVKDLRDLKDAKTQVPVGEGAMPVVAIFKELAQRNYQGCVNLEYEVEEDNPLSGMAKSIAYMRGVLAGLHG
jgi:sugar phosphate isomerase/epimerase